MKKRILFILVCVLTAVSAYSQPTAAYYAENESGTYSELIGGTSVLPSEFPTYREFNACNWGPDGQIAADSGDVTGFPIGFNFRYNNKNMTQFIVGPGYIVLGDENGVSSNDPVASSSRFNIVTNSSYENFIGVFIINDWGAYEDTEITYATSGEEGSRVLVVQFKNIGACASRFNYNEEDFEKVQLQLRLYEETGNIEFVFNDWQPKTHSDSDMNNVSIKIGFKGSDGEFVMLTSYTGTNISINSSAQMTWNTSSYPEDGRTVTFVAPEDCTAPSAPTDLVLTSYSNYIEGSFTPSEDADHYLVLISESSTLSGYPQDNVFYSAGDVIGDATVVAYTTNTSFTTSSNLNGSTTYYLYVFANNSYCMFGPKYQSDVLSGSSSTKLDMPGDLTVAEADITYVTLNAIANSSNDKLLIASTTEASYNGSTRTTDGVFGTPSGKLSVGDEIDGGGQVVYIGEAKDGIAVEGLEENMFYHFQAWSTDGEEAYSTTYSKVNTTTGSNVPFVSNFGMVSLYNEDLDGWDFEGPWRTDRSTTFSNDTILSCTTTANSAEGVVNYISTPVIQLAESANRVILEFVMQQYYGRSWSIYSDWADGDVLRVEATTDGVNYTTIYEITPENVPEMASGSFSKVYMPFYDLAGKKVHIRLYWKTYDSNNARIYVGSIKVEEKADCDYPINLTAEASSNQAVLDWDLQGNEGAWEVRYKLSDSEEWGDVIAVNTKPYTLTDLPPLSDIDVQIRAKCDANTYSEWSETYTFRSGYGVPYTEEFSDGSLPSDWSTMTGELASPTEFTGSSSFWRYVSGMTGKYLAFDPTTTEGLVFDEWLIFPTVDMGDGSVNYIMSINYTRQATAVGTDDSYQFLVSANDEFNESDVIETFSHDEVNADGFAEFTTRLEGYSGMITPAFYIKSTTGRPIAFRVNSISILESCPSDISDVVLSDTTDTSVKVEWSTEAETSYVFIRKAGETDKPYVATTEKSMVFDGLDDRTDYEIGITKMCEEGDTAKVTIVTFTTLTYEGCPQVTDVDITPSKYEATITWEGEAEAYNVRYRKDGDDEWIVVSDIRENTVTLTDLDCATDYLCGIQSKCSTLETDVSEYTDDYKFTTLEETCFPPEDITVDPSIYSALVKWTGESDSYAIGYALKDSNEWTEEQINTTEYTIEGLTPETDYKVRVRTYCSEEDYSQWSDAVEFTTLEIPECVTPTDLTVDEITDSSAKLSWKADEENLSWIIHYRKGDASAWTIVGDIEDTQYELKELDENASYIWSVMAECEWSESDWASQNTFTTSTATGISNVDLSDIKVFVSNNILNVSNPANGYIHSVVLYSVSGEMLKEYVVNTSENVFIPLNNYSGQVVIVKVNGEKTEKIVKVSL